MSYDDNYKPLPKFLLGLFCALAFISTFFMAESFEFSKAFAIFFSFLMSLTIYLIHRE